MLQFLIRLGLAIKRHFSANDPSELTLGQKVYRLIENQACRAFSDLNSIQIPLAEDRPVQIHRPIAVIFHCHHIDLFEGIFLKIFNIPYPVKVFINTTSDAKKELILQILKNYGEIDCEVRVTENRGRDMVCKYVTFRDVYAHCDIFLHIHDKKSLYIGSRSGCSWRNYLIESLMGSSEIVNSNLSLLNESKVGLVFPRPYFATTKKDMWRKRNLDICNRLCEQLGIEIDLHNYPDFPSGGMTWGKSKVIEPLINFGFRVEDFPVEDDIADGYLHHALERMSGVVCLSMGLTCVKTTMK